MKGENFVGRTGKVATTGCDDGARGERAAGGIENAIARDGVNRSRAIVLAFRSQTGVWEPEEVEWPAIDSHRSPATLLLPATPARC